MMHFTVEEENLICMLLLNCCWISMLCSCHFGYMFTWFITSLNCSFFSFSWIALSEKYFSTFL